MLPAASAVSIPAVTMFVNVPAKIMKARIRRNISAPLSATWSASTAFWRSPMG